MAEMKWSLNLRIFAMLRRLVVAAEGIEKELRYQNERSFPPLYDMGVRKRAVFSRKKPEDQN